MASWSLSEGEKGPGADLGPSGIGQRHPAPSESDYFACPGPCERPSWRKAPGYCFNCGQRLVPVKSAQEFYRVVQGGSL